MTNFEKLLAALEELKATLLNAIMAADCSKAMERWLDREAEPMPEAPREAGGYGGHGPVCDFGWDGDIIIHVDSHGRVHEIGCRAGARAYDVNGKLVLELPE